LRILVVFTDFLVTRVNVPRVGSTHQGFTLLPLPSPTLGQMAKQ
jgi:hypothetical protein